MYTAGRNGQERYEGGHKPQHARYHWEALDVYNHATYFFFEKI